MSVHPSDKQWANLLATSSMTKRPLIPRWLGLTISAPVWLPLVAAIYALTLVLRIPLFFMKCTTASLSDWPMRRRVAYALSAFRF
jgi:hypothetical protein